MPRRRVETHTTIPPIKPAVDKAALVKAAAAIPGALEDAFTEQLAASAKPQDVAVPALPAGADPLAILAQILGTGIKQAIDASRPQKKNVFTVDSKTPWSPEEGQKRTKLKRKMFMHSLLIDGDMINNEEAELLNKVRPGVYCDGFVKVHRRRDKGLNIDFPLKTADHKMRLASQYGINSLVGLLQRCIKEADNPVPQSVQDEN